MSAERQEAGTALERRVTVLEDLTRQIAARMGIPADVPMTEEQVAEFRRLFDEAMRKPYDWKVLPSPPPLTPDEVRQLLRESVTVVKPGEVLFYTYGDPNGTPNQIREMQQVINGWLECNAPEVKVLVLPHGGVTVAERHDFMKDVRKDIFRHEHVEAVRLTHVPTGIVVDAPTEGEAIRKLAAALASRGDITINDGRRALGLPEWTGKWADTAQALLSD